jgi:hypothetical protein
MLVNGLNDEEAARLRATQGDPVKGAIVTLQTVAERLSQATVVDAAEQQSVSAQASLGARPALGGSSPAAEVRQAKLADFRASDAARIPSLVVAEQAGRVEQAQRRLDEVRGGLVEAGDSAQEQRNTRMLEQTRMRLGDGATIVQALAELERHAGNSHEVGLVADDLKAKYSEHSELIEKTLARIDPQLAAAARDLANKQHDFEIVKTVAGAVEAGIRTGSAPTSSYFDSVAKAVKRQ